jgi:CRP-like cAMP-binding protein
MLPPVGRLRDDLAKKRQAEFHERNTEHWSHVKGVQAAANAARDERKAVIAARIDLRRRNELPPIERCATAAERAALCADSWRTSLVHPLFVQQLGAAVQLRRATAQLVVLFVPMLRAWRLRRAAIARRYAALWRGRLSRPTVDRLVEAFPGIAGWPDSALGRLRRLLRPRVYREGAYVMHEGEPLVAALIIDRGTVAVTQRADPAASPAASPEFPRRSGAPAFHSGAFATPPTATPPASRTLGERGPGSVHGEEALESTEVERHRPPCFASLRCVGGPVTGWSLQRSDFVRVAQSVPLATCNADAVDLGRTMRMPAPHSLPLMRMLDNRSLHFWSEERLADLVQGSRLVALRRGDALFRRGDDGGVSYIAYKGTLEERRHPVHWAGTTTPAAEISETTLSKRFINPADSFGEEAVIFNEGRDSTVVAVTDAVVFEIDGAALTRGLLSDPAAFLDLIGHYANRRERQLQRPSAAELEAAGVFPAPVAAVFARHARPMVCQAGQTDLPLQSALVLVGSGRVIIGLHKFAAPCVLTAPEVLQPLAAPVAHRTEGRVDAWVLDAALLTAKVKGLGTVFDLLPTAPTGPRGEPSVLTNVKYRDVVAASSTVDVKKGSRQSGAAGLLAASKARSSVSDLAKAEGNRRRR